MHFIWNGLWYHGPMIHNMLISHIWEEWYNRQYPITFHMKWSMISDGYDLTIWLYHMWQAHDVTGDITVHFIWKYLWYHMTMMRNCSSVTGAWYHLATIWCHSHTISLGYNIIYVSNQSIYSRYITILWYHIWYYMEQGSRCSLLTFEAVNLEFWLCSCNPATILV